MSIVPFLETERVLLRGITSADEDTLLDLDSDPEVMRYISQGVPSTRAEVKAALARISAMLTKHNGRFGCWAAIDKSSEQFIGWFLFRPPYADSDNTKRIELGYRLKQRFWGNGYATEVSKAILAKAFEYGSIAEVFAVAVKDNVGSQTVMKKCGMELVREFTSREFTGNLESLVEYSIAINPMHKSQS